jgi:hypothetical protein
MEEREKRREKELVATSSAERLRDFPCFCGPATTSRLDEDTGTDAEGVEQTDEERWVGPIGNKIIIFKIDEETSHCIACLLY